MAEVRTAGVAVRGVVGAIPQAAFGVRELGTRAGMDPVEVERISRRVGLDRMHRVDQSQTSLDLCCAAAEALLHDIDWKRESVDGLLFVTQTPDYCLPANACIAHARLHFGRQALAMDVNLGCSGYVYGMMTAAQLIAGGLCRRVLLLGGDTVSRVLHPGDAGVALLFGDAGSATALEADSGHTIAFVAGTDGTGWEHLRVESGGFRVPADAAHPPRLHMDGLAVFEFALRQVPELIDQTLRIQGWGRGDVDYFLLHQANGFMLDTLRRKLGVRAERWPMNLARYGNTSVASLPLLLADNLAEVLRQERRCRILLAGFGVGWSFAAAALETAALRSARVVEVEAHAP